MILFTSQYKKAWKKLRKDFSWVRNLGTSIQDAM